MKPAYPVPIAAVLWAYLKGVAIYVGAVSLMFAANHWLSRHPVEVVPVCFGIFGAACLGVVDAHVRLLPRWTPPPSNEA